LYYSLRELRTLLVCQQHQDIIQEEKSIDGDNKSNKSNTNTDRDEGEGRHKSLEEEGKLYWWKKKS